MLALKKTCGIHTAESKLTTIGDREVVLIKRFDRNKTDKATNAHGC